jgi:hypothetical protein
VSEKALPDENDVTLCENDDNDMSIILNKIFPDCPDKMKTFCFHKKWHLRGIQMGFLPDEIWSKTRDSVVHSAKPINCMSLPRFLN